MHPRTPQPHRASGPDGLHPAERRLAASAPSVEQTLRKSSLLSWCVGRRRKSCGPVRTPRPHAPVRQPGLRPALTLPAPPCAPQLGPARPATEQALALRDGTALLPLAIPRPLGVVFAEAQVKLSGPSIAVVEEVAPGSNAAAAGVRVGDVLRLVSCVVEVRGKVDVVSFYANPPKAAYRRALLVADAQPFPKLMKALLSNSTAVDLPGGESRVFADVPLVLERRT